MYNPRLEAQTVRPAEPGDRPPGLAVAEFPEVLPRKPAEKDVTPVTSPCYPNAPHAFLGMEVSRQISTPPPMGSS